MWPNFYVGSNYQDELNFLKTWIGDRLVWLDNNIGGNCYEILGCIDPFACNYDPLANTNDGSCNYNSSSYDTLISNISINWNGLVLTNSGDYSVTLYNIVGCDSIVNLNFTLNTISAISYSNTNERVLVEITDILGRKVDLKEREILYYIFDDGTVERRIIIE